MIAVLLAAALLGVVAAYYRFVHLPAEMLEDDAAATAELLETAESAPVSAPVSGPAIAAAGRAEIDHARRVVTITQDQPLLGPVRIEMHIAAFKQVAAELLHSEAVAEARTLSGRIVRPTLIT